MPVHFYLGRDLQGQSSEPVFHHESDGLQRICRHLWKKYRAEQTEYAVVANVQRVGPGQELSPHLVIISEFGLGVVELKDHFGHIDCRNPKGRWLAGKVTIKSQDKTGLDEKGRPQEYVNPAAQVRYYAKTMRQHLLSQQLHAWLPDHPNWKDMKLQTAVCFTNLLADTQHCQAEIIARYPPLSVLEAWEVLSVITPAEIAEWAFNLRFDLQAGHASFYRTLTLAPDEVQMLAEQFLGGKTWSRMHSLLQAEPAPYGYLDLLNEEGRSLFRYQLEHDELLVGRDAQACALHLTDQYRYVSRKHIRLVHTAEGVFIQDAGSTHGTLLDGSPAHGRCRLKPGAIITLGLPERGSQCRLRYSQIAEPPAKPTSFE